MMLIIAGIRIPDSKIAIEATEFVRGCESELLFNHSMRVFLFGALMGDRQNVKYDAEMLYVASMFHDIGLLDDFTSPDERFEVDGANVAKSFLRVRGVPEDQANLVWEAIALHTTPGIPQHMRPVIALCRAGVRMDVVGTAYGDYSDAEREAVNAAFPRGDFKNGFIEAQAHSARRKPLTTYGTINSDYLEWTDPAFSKPNQCQNILRSPWKD